jgi:hypothetical protein
LATLLAAAALTGLLRLLSGLLLRVAALLLTGFLATLVLLAALVLLARLVLVLLVRHQITPFAIPVTIKT